jgi:ketosteroid isomerase-like protein
MRFTRMFTAALVTLAACQKAETPEQAAARMEQETAAARTAIEAQSAAFGTHFSAGHADQVAALYTEDGEILPPNEKAVAGRANIQAYFATVLGAGTTSLTLTTGGVAASGTHAVERGSYVLSFTPGPNAPKELKAVNDTGKYVAHWVNQGGTWLMAHDMWSSDLPAPQP